MTIIPDVSGSNGGDVGFPKKISNFTIQKVINIIEIHTENGRHDIYARKSAIG
jgi:hypothetical protein